MSTKRTPILKRPRQDDMVDTPRCSSRLADIVDARLAKFSESIAQMIRDSEAIIVTEVSNSVEDLKSECLALSARVEVVEATSNEILGLKESVAVLKARVNSLENLSVSNELRIRGVPVAKDEKLRDLFRNLCSTVDVHAPVVKHIRRLNGGSSSGPPDIIVKLDSHIERNNVLRMVAILKKNNKVKNLCLLHFGMEVEGEHPVYVNDNMSRPTYNIFKSALSLKKENRLWAVYCLRGLVHVRLNKDDEAISIDDVKKLAAF